MTRQSTRKFRDYEVFVEDFNVIVITVKYSYHSPTKGLFFNEPFEVEHPNKDNHTISVAAFKSESPHEVVKKVIEYLEKERVVKEPLEYNKTYVDSQLQIPTPFASAFIFSNDLINIVRKYKVAYDKDTNKYFVKDTRVNRELLSNITLEELNSQFVEISDKDFEDFEYHVDAVHKAYTESKLKLNEKLFKDCEQLFKEKLLGIKVSPGLTSQDPDLTTLLNRYAKN